MNRNAAFFRNLGAVSFAKGETLLIVNARSWQEKAFIAGWLDAKDVTRLVNKSYTREQRKMEAILAKGRAKMHIRQMSVGAPTRAERRASMQFVSHNIVRKAA